MAEIAFSNVWKRLDAASTAAAGAELELALDTARIKLFHPASGRSLTTR